jgi:hypothetical protein
VELSGCIDSVANSRGRHRLKIGGRKNSIDPIAFCQGNCVLSNRRQDLYFARSGNRHELALL